MHTLTSLFYHNILYKLLHLYYTFQDETGLNNILKQDGFIKLMNYFKDERLKLGWNYNQCDDFLGIKASYCYWDKPTTHPYRIPEEKHYLTLNNYLKNMYNEKVFKVSLNGNFSCPNRDGKISTNGCIFCSAKGSGDFAGNIKDDLITQFYKQKEIIRDYFNYYFFSLCAVCFLQNLQNLVNSTLSVVVFLFLLVS